MVDYRERYKQIVIGIDQSYRNTGISIAADGKLMKVSSIPLDGLQNNSEKRLTLKNKLIKVLDKMSGRAIRIKIVCERIRTFSGGFLSTDYIKATGALIATIVDVAREYDVPVYSVDTRTWKSAIVGTSKGDDTGNKGPTIEYVRKLGFEEDLLVPLKRARKGSFMRDGQHYCWNDDAADSACIALYGCIPETQWKAKIEKI